MPTAFDQFPDVNSGEPKSADSTSDVTVPTPLESFDQVNQTLDPNVPPPDVASEGGETPPRDEKGRFVRSERAEKRINKLIGQREEAREARLQAEAEAEELRSRTKLLEERLASLETARQPAPAPSYSTSYDSYGGEGESQQQQSQQDFSKVIANELNRQLEPFKNFMSAQQQEAQKRQQLVTLRQHQQQSLVSAAEDFPDLKDPQSELYQLADQLMTSDEALAADPNGPYKAATMARGILYEDARDDLTTEQAKLAASVNNGPALGGVNAGNADLTQYREQLKLMKQSRDPSLFLAARKAQLKDVLGRGQ